MNAYLVMICNAGDHDNIPRIDGAYTTKEAAMGRAAELTRKWERWPAATFTVEEWQILDSGDARPREYRPNHYSFEAHQAR